MNSFNYSESCYDWFDCILESVQLSSSNTLFQGSCQYDVRWLLWLLIKVSALQLHHSPPPVWPCPSNKNTLWSRYITSASPVPLNMLYKLIDLLIKPQTTHPVSHGSFGTDWCLKLKCNVATCYCKSNVMFNIKSKWLMYRQKTQMQ